MTNRETTDDRFHLSEIAARIAPGLSMRDTCALLNTLGALATGAKEHALAAWLLDLSAGFLDATFAKEGRSPFARQARALDALAGKFHPDTDGPEIARLAARLIRPWGAS
jgi:hypothetical protein